MTAMRILDGKQLATVNTDINELGHEAEKTKKLRDGNR